MFPVGEAGVFVSNRLGGGSGERIAWPGHTVVVTIPALCERKVKTRSAMHISSGFASVSRILGLRQRSINV
jgi:hypothetical protein